MRLRRFLVPVLLAGVSSVLTAHDLFLTLAAYFVSPGSDVNIVALNGTFTTSENSIDRKRIEDLSLVGPVGRRRLDTTTVTPADTLTRILVRIDSAGTYVAGLSLRPSEISLQGPEFNAYLTEEGLTSVLAARRKAGELAKPARERYSKHVKVMFQAGKTRSDAWSAVLGYPVEIVPLRNPYDLGAGDTLRVRLLIAGTAAPAGVEVLAGGRLRSGARRTVRHLSTDAAGTVVVPLGAAGTAYVKFIHMIRPGDLGVDYLSQWATLTFAVASSPRKEP